METTHTTTHTALFGDARDLSGVADASIDLAVTSPPYPMIEMWDAAFARMDPAAGLALERGDGPAAFEVMHRQLDRVWAACWRVIKPGGTLCVNIGDATRTVAGSFRLYPNHARALTGAMATGFEPLPDILWRKPTNSPNKFMGSGMLPPGAYVTYEHEYVLVLRRGARRTFKASERQRRRESAYFWEERNVWFSDLWTGLTGVGQGMARGAARKRSAAFPLALPWRLVQMYSLYGDTVLDPFLGTGTTALAAAAAGRSSVGVEIDPALAPTIQQTMTGTVKTGQRLQRQRLAAHRSFVAERTGSGRPPAHHNAALDTPVVTRQETGIRVWVPAKLQAVEPLICRVAYARGG